MEKAKKGAKMSKLNIVRFSGAPVEPEAFKLFDAEYKAEFDKLQELHAQDMLKFHEELKKLDEQLAAKYANIFTEELPTSQKSWRELTEKYDAPIMLARSSEDPKKLILVVMDMPLT